MACVAQAAADAAQAYAEEKALQMEREAINGAAPRSDSHKDQAAPSAARQPGSYEVPDWGGAPEG